MQEFTEADRIGRHLEQVKQAEDAVNADRIAFSTDREIDWLASNRFHTPENQPTPEVQDEITRLWNRQDERWHRDLNQAVPVPLSYEQWRHLEEVWKGPMCLCPKGQIYMGCPMHGNGKLVVEEDDRGGRALLDGTTVQVWHYRRSRRERLKDHQVVILIASVGLIVSLIAIWMAWNGLR